MSVPAARNPSLGTSRGYLSCHWQRLDRFIPPSERSAVSVDAGSGERPARTGNGRDEVGMSRLFEGTDEPGIALRPYSSLNVAMDKVGLERALDNLWVTLLNVRNRGASPMRAQTCREP